MKKRFIVAVDDEGHPQRELRRERFIGYAKGRGLGLWNRVPSVWLIVDSAGQLTAGQLNKDAYEIFDASCLIIELRGDDSADTWSGHGPKGAFEWMKRNWRLSAAENRAATAAENKAPPA